MYGERERMRLEGICADIYVLLILDMLCMPECKCKLHTYLSPKSGDCDHMLVFEVDTGRGTTALAPICVQPNG